MITISRNTETNPSLLVPTRMDVFGIVVRPTGKPRTNAKHPFTPIQFLPAGWQGWNADGTMESRMSRLPSSGSFYWNGAVLAVCAAKRMMQKNRAISQIKIETISGVEVARMYQS